MRALSLFLLCSLCLTASLFAQEVPETIEFAGTTLKLTPSAKRLVQNQVNLLLEDQDVFVHKVEVADTYMPLITEVLAQNDLPLDFKYLALLDDTSADSLIFWQMSEKLGLDLGLTINDDVDERENLYTVSEKVSNFLKINHVLVHNWWLTLLSYQFKSGDPVQEFQKLFPGKSLAEVALRKAFTLDQNTHPQIIKLLAKAVAFSDQLKTDPRRDVELVNFQDASGKTLEQIAKQFSLPQQELMRYNGWLKSSKIPSDKNYDVLIPMPTASPSANVQFLTAPSGEYTYTTSDESYVHVVERGETLYKISRQYQVSVQDLMRWNRLNQNSILNIGQKLYIVASDGSLSPAPTPTPNPNTETQNTRRTTRTTTTTSFTHRVQKGETLYGISRKYKVSVVDIKKWNRLTNNNLNIGQSLQIQKQTTVKPLPEPPKETKTPVKDVPVSTTPVPDTRPTPGTPTTDTGNPPRNNGVRVIRPKRIPDVMTIGGIQLNITRKGKRALKKDIDLLTRSQSYFFKKLNRVDLYMPLIEEALEDENVPLDFKYLPIQESALIAAARSRSNAVGYWQFKEASGKEVGLSINSRVDERMNIVASSRAACKYLKRNNLYYDNWIIALLSYNMGFTGAKFYVKKHFPKRRIQDIKKMDIDENTHWYIRKFLAHKIAFENELGLEKLPKTLTTYTQGKQKTLQQIARENQSTEKELKPHNLWLKKNRVPGDKTYTVIVPLKNR